MKRYDISTPRSGNVSGIGGGIHSFAVSFVVKKSGTVRASDLGLPFFYISPLQEGEVTITPLNNNEKVTLPSDFMKNNVGGFLPIQVKEITSANDIIIGL